ncbi:BMP family lipoprotein [Lapidilactobacillus gannanensis]|jgi:basic membrane protein A|uniref:BMP family protein n=1 Tax=Lapidilactobacillus gannanensis TaxID=2486002 RepID=A0ABW4BLM0_9LACO|nr:BMP family ABC transporter substrate-binding protein [Lapidilactobacillus gannanensis]MCH4058298.1 BMP family ABC transporter substrate-binding protein [Lactobacillaceae bacterium]
MKKAKIFTMGILAAAVVLSLSACAGKKSGTSNSGSSKTTKNTVALITDTGGVDDRSFNQSAWEGLQKWGKEHDLKRGNSGFQYFQSDNESSYIPNIDQAMQAGFKTIFGIGYKLKDAIKQSAKKDPKTNFVIIDDSIDGIKNVVSATFKDNESSYLAGVAAAYTTKTNTVGFIGGVKGDVIDRFDAGYTEGVKAGAKELGKSIKIINQYAGDFSAPDKGKSIAQGMYQQGADIIFHASGATGNGVFQEAKSINQAGTKQVWVIGVDRDQTTEGKYKTKDGKSANFTLTSTLKGVGAVTEDLANLAMKDKFPGGKHMIYGLKDDGVGLTKGQLSSKAQKAVDAAKQDIIDGKVKVSEHPAK